MMTQEEFKKLPANEQLAILKQLEHFSKLAKEHEAADSLLPQMNMKDFEEKIKGIMEAQIRTMTPADKRHFAFPGIGTDKSLMDRIDPEAKFAKTQLFLRALAGGETQVLKDMDKVARTKANLSEGTASAGGFLVPEEFKAEILRLVPMYGVMRANARMIPMMSDVAHIPVSNIFNYMDSRSWPNCTNKRQLWSGDVSYQ